MEFLAAGAHMAYAMKCAYAKAFMMIYQCTHTHTYTHTHTDIQFAVPMHMHTKKLASLLGQVAAGACNAMAKDLFAQYANSNIIETKRRRGHAPWQEAAIKKCCPPFGAGIASESPDKAVKLFINGLRCKTINKERLGSGHGRHVSCSILPVCYLGGGEGHATVDDVAAQQRAVVGTIYKGSFARCCFGCMLVAAFANRKLRISVIA